MEVMKMFGVTDETIEELKNEGCFLEPFTINGEEWLYMVHPVKGKKHE